MDVLVSIITPSYNSEKFIADAIRSVQAQTVENWELIIIDDCSTDQTVEIIRSFQSDARIILDKLPKNSGAGVARDLGVSRAKGRYVAFLDSDDMWKPEKLSRQLDYMETHRQPFSFSFYELMDESGNPMNKLIKCPEPLTYRMLFFCNFVGNLTGIYDTSKFGKIGISAIRKRQDWIMWLTILKQIRSAQPIAESLAFYRVRQDSISSSKVMLLRHNYNVYRKFHKLNVPEALFCMAVFMFVQLVVKPFYKSVRPASETA